MLGRNLRLFGPRIDVQNCFRERFGRSWFGALKSLGESDWLMNTQSRDAKDLAHDVVLASIIVPVFNEAESVSQLRDRLMPIAQTLSADGVVEVIVVDDGSTDGTSTLVRKELSDSGNISIRLLCHTENRGVGAAIATGFANANGEIVCVIDSDCSYNPEELPNVIDLLKSSGADIATASPYHPEGAVEGCPAWRIALSKLASVAYSYVTPTRLHCYTSIFRVYRKEWARPEFITKMGFVGVTEHLLTAMRAGAQVVEYPTTLYARVYGVSKMRTVRVAMSHLGLIARTFVDRRSGKALLGSDSIGKSLSNANTDSCNFEEALTAIDSAIDSADVERT